MKKRLLWSAFAMTVLVLLGFFAPLLYWRITGLVRGEAFYAGKPSCYWREAAKEEFGPHFNHLLAPNDIAPLSAKSWRDSYLEWKGLWLPSQGDPWVKLQKDPDALPVLRDLFHDQDDEIRAVAAATICTLGENAPDMIPAMIQYTMTEAKGDVQGLIAYRIANFDNGRAVPILCQWLDHDDETALIAMEIIRVFGHRAEAAIPSLLKNMEKEDDRSARYLLPVLGPKSVPGLRALLKDENVHARRNATETLAVWKEDNFPGRVALLVQQSSDPDPAVRILALASLLAMPEKNADALASLTKMLHDPDAKVRINAIGAITNVYRGRDGPEMRGILAEFRSLANFDESADVRAAAKNAVECAREQ